MPQYRFTDVPFLTEFPFFWLKYLTLRREHAHIYAIEIHYGVPLHMVLKFEVLSLLPKDNLQFSPVLNKLLISSKKLPSVFYCLDVPFLLF